MSTLEAYRRTDGTVGIRNHLFALPAVVCANQVAIDVAREHPALKYIEHQHGCAQIGDDLIQTGRIFRQLALHPNVYASMFISLGCEGIVAKDLYARTKSLGQKSIDLVVIQETGGTLNTEQYVKTWIENKQEEIAGQSRAAVTWEDLTIGFLFDTSPIAASSPAIVQCLEALRDLGAHIILPVGHADILQSFHTEAALVEYGQPTSERISVMQGGSTLLETSTALTAAGAHLIVHFAANPHGFGNPLAPVVRYAIDDHLYSLFFDDFDGQVKDNLDVPRFVEQLARIVNGQESVAEELKMDDFALYRIGPTV